MKIREHKYTHTHKLILGLQITLPQKSAYSVDMLNFKFLKLAESSHLSVVFKIAYVDLRKD